MHRIAPPDPLPEFYVEAGYLRQLVIDWELKEYGAGHCMYLVDWGYHRHMLLCATGIRDNGRILKCVQFVDDLIGDLLRHIFDKAPLRPLDTARLSEFREHIRYIESIKSENRIYY